MSESNPTAEAPSPTVSTAAAAPDAIDPAALDRSVEAVLMTVDRPVSAARLAEVVGAESAKIATDAIARLNEHYEQSERSFRIESVAGGYQILTLAEHKGVLENLHRGKVDNKLSPAALETLAIIAYRQPVLRADIEAIRGVAAGEVVRTLMEKHLVKIVGRAEELGRPMLYGTTKTFLEVFGLSALKDLPTVAELKKP